MDVKTEQISEIKEETKTFKIELNEEIGNYLKGIFETQNNILKETILKTDIDGLTFTGIDEAYIQLFNFKLLSDDGLSYTFNGEQKHYIDASELNNVFKRWKKGYNITFELNEPGILKIIFINNRNLKKEFSLKLLDLDYDIPIPPAHEESNFNDVTVLLKDLKEIIGDLETVDYKFWFIMENMKLYLTAESEKGIVKIKIPIKTNKTPFNTKTQISLDKVKDSINKLNNTSSKEINLKLGTDLPVSIISYYLSGYGSYMETLTAPRIIYED